MHDSWQAILLQWRQTPRLRIGVLIIYVILSSYIVILLQDHRDGLMDSYTKQQARLHKVRNISTQDQWSQRADEARAHRIRAEASLWSADSKGLAQATLQSWFTQKLGPADLANLAVDTELASEAPGVAGVWQVTAELKGPVSRQQLITLLKLLELSDKLITIQHLKLTRTRTGLALLIQLRAWFLNPSTPGIREP